MKQEKAWIKKGKELLADSLNPIPQELNELDWKEALSPSNSKLTKHLSAFANMPGGGFLVFGVEDGTGVLKGVSTRQSVTITEKLGSLGRDTLSPVIKIDHSVESYNNVPILFIYIAESLVKPVHFTNGTIEDTYIRSGGTTRKASRQEVGGLMLNSKTPQFEELHCSSLKTAKDVLESIDYLGVYQLLNKPVAQSKAEILGSLVSEKLVDEIDGTGYYVTNLGALAGAKNLHDFESLSRKSIRLIRYDGLNREIATGEYPGSRGYAIGFSGLIAR